MHWELHLIHSTGSSMSSRHIGTASPMPRRAGERCCRPPCQAWFPWPPHACAAVAAIPCCLSHRWVSCHRARAECGDHRGRVPHHAIDSGWPRPVSAMCWADRLRPTRPFGLPGTTDRTVHWAEAMGRSRPGTPLILFQFWILFKYFKKQFKLSKFVETCRNVQKGQTKFCLTPLG
jgi:hypothetical protein